MSGSKTAFFVDEIKGKPRPRFYRGHVYPDRRQVEYEREVLARFKQAGGRKLAGPVAVRIDIWRHLPASTPKRVQSAPDTHTPDVDNIAKSVLDALNGSAWADDKQVVKLTVVKHDRTRRGGDLMQVVVENA